MLPTYQCAGRLALSSLLGVFLLSACGGGGGGNGGSSGSSSLSITLAPNPLTDTVYTWDLPTSVTLAGTVSGSTSASSVYVVVIDHGGTFASGPVQLNQTGPNTYQTALTLPAGTTEGAHNSTLTVQACGDLNCNNVLAQSTEPYQITVKPNPTLTVTSSTATLTGSAIQGISQRTNEQTTVLTVNDPVFTFEGSPIYPVYLQATDPNGVVMVLPIYNAYYLPITGPFNSPKFQLDFDLGGTLVQGHNTGTLKFKLCHDNRCQKVFNGSSTLPYDIVLGPGTQPALAPLAGASDWTTLQGSASHSGYVPATVNISAFSPRWVGSAPASSELVTAGNNVFALSRPFGQAYGFLHGIKESDGSIIWSNGGAQDASGLLVDAGIVYLPEIDSSGSGIGMLSAYNAANGSAVFSQSYTEPQNGTSVYPAPAGNLVLMPSAVNNFAYPQLTSLNATTGGASGSPACLQAQEQTSGFRESEAPAVDSAQTAYFGTSAGLMIARFGSPQTCTLIPFAFGSGSTPGVGNPAVLTDAGSVIVPAGSLYDFDLSRNALKWSKTDASYTQPSFGNGVVYVGNLTMNNVAEDNRTTVQALSESDGSLLWSWTPPYGSGSVVTTISNRPFVNGSIIVTKNIVFVVTEQRVHALDLSTHQSVWSANEQASLAISSNGILYLVGSVFMAVNLH